MVDEFHIYDREKDKEVLVEMGLNGGRCDAGAYVIPIVGMGGVGKTTLTQLVYNDEEVKKGFDTKVWICVSEEFDVLKVTRVVSQAISIESYDNKDPKLLQVRLKERL